MNTQTHIHEPMHAYTGREEGVRKGECGVTQSFVQRQRDLNSNPHNSQEQHLPHVQKKDLESCLLTPAVTASKQNPANSIQTFCIIRKHMCSHVHMYAHMHIQSQLPHINTHLYTCINTQYHTHTCTHISTHLHTNLHTLIHRETYTHSHTDILKYAHINRYIHMRSSI